MTPLRQRMIEDMQVRNLAPPTRLGTLYTSPCLPPFSHIAGAVGFGRNT
jgi:hypothetical protein